MFTESDPQAFSSSILAKMSSKFKTGSRAQKADPAIIEDVMRLYMKPNVTNMAAGCAYWGPPAEVCTP